MKNTEQIFSLALGIEAHWHIQKVVFNHKTSQLDIYLDVKKEY